MVTRRSAVKGAFKGAGKGARGSGRVGHGAAHARRDGELHALDLGIGAEVYPFTGRSFDRGGLRYHYLDEGTGPVVVMVHGNPTWSILYRHLVRGLRARFRCLVPDHIGCGLSDKPPVDRYDYRLRSRIDDLEAWLAATLAPDTPVHLVVHDWGGMIGLGWAGRHSDRVRSLTIANTAAFHLPEYTRVPTPIALARDHPLAPVFVRGFNAFARGAARTCVTARPMARSVREAYCAPYASWADSVAVWGFVQDIPLATDHPSYATVSEVEKGLARLIDIPTLLLWGGRDFVFDGRVLSEWRRRLPRAHVHEIYGAGHYVFEDAPEATTEAVAAFLEGVPTAEPAAPTPDAVVNVAQCLPELAARTPEQTAIVMPDGTEWSYRALDEESDRLASGLTRAGIGRGVRTALMVKPSPELFLLSFALAKAGAVPVIVDPGVGLGHFQMCLDEAKPQAFIGLPEAHVARLALGWARRSVEVSVCVGRPVIPGTRSLDEIRALGTLPFAAAPTRGEDVAAILFTSGSTGPPKGAVYTHGNFDAQIRILRDIAGIAPGEVDVPTFPVFALFDPALGMTSVVPPIDPTRPGAIDPGAVIAPILRHEATNLFGSPALLARLVEGAPDARLPSLKRIVTAGAPLHEDVLHGCLAMLGPGAQVLSPYGATEALPVALIGSDARLDAEIVAMTQRGAGICVGRPVPETEVRVIAIDDHPIAEWSDTHAVVTGEVGEIVVSGPQVTTSYFDRPDRDAAAKIRDGDRIWHRMGDLGRLDEAGRLWFCGRKAHRVRPPTGPEMYPVPCEVVFNAHPEVRRSALVGPRRGDGVVRPTIVLEPYRWLSRADRTRLRADVLDRARAHEHTASIEAVAFRRRFPVDRRHNAKIDRPALTAWLEGRRRR
ncbi:MAG: fatty acid CoA ligase family protein [Myxococcota bacterium]